MTKIHGDNRKSEDVENYLCQLYGKPERYVQDKYEIIRRGGPRRIVARDELYLYKNGAAVLIEHCPNSGDRRGFWCSEFEIFLNKVPKGTELRKIKKDLETIISEKT